MSTNSTADFGTVVRGSSASKTFTIRNKGFVDSLTNLAVIRTAAGMPDDFTVSPIGAATLEPNEFATFTATFSPAGSGIRTSTLELASNDPDENPFVINLTGRQATDSEAWRSFHFGSFSNTGAGADFSDPDKDGIINLMEYATGSDPLAPTISIGQILRNGSVIEFAYTRRKSALPEVSLRREFSETLTGTWTPAANAVVTILSDDGVMQEAKGTVPAGPNGKQFVRLRVTRL